MTNNDTADKNQVPSGYICVSQPILRLGSLSIEAIQPEHIEKIRQWRNAQMDVLRQATLITTEQQTAYFQKYIWPDMLCTNPKNILLAYMEDGTLIGYGGLVHIAWEHMRAEVSFLLNPTLIDSQDKYGTYFSAFLQLLKELAFQDIGLDRIFTETYALRTHHISVLESIGFDREGVLKNHIKIDGKSVDSIIHGCIKI